jgi:hypothetical protein
MSLKSSFTHNLGQDTWQRPANKRSECGRVYLPAISVANGGGNC